ncbi:putative nuclease HARBI1 [Nylanderia fulva]|uniref:putative nuclease HARBI1 n=1 Tax=Nylanderia fulva TaxID=613905 RepID=UPI0010FB26F1|nr:putative nuclease HARBI1 [Nylanderia fulva]
MNKRQKCKRKSGTDCHYGPQSQKPDLLPEVFEQLRQNHLEKLFKNGKNWRQIERNTIKQSNSDLWHSLRQELLTASNFGIVLAALRFYASGSYQNCIGKNIHMAISQPSISRCVRNVTNILNRPEIFNTWVCFPNNLQKLQQLRNKFWIKHRFPGVIGCIDCTHVAIVPPPKEDENYPEHIYVNRKGYHSINVQLICDSDLRIMNVNARYPGSTHDSYIWNNSNVLPIMQDIYNRGHNFFLLGDSGYALRPWMMTPIMDNNLNIATRRYNDRQKSTRSLIERCNGVLKMRFRCLLKHRVLHYRPDVCSKIINACTILHNMCIHDKVPLPDEAFEDEVLDFGMLNVMDGVNEPGINLNRNIELIAGRRIRNNLIRHYFS